MNRTHNFFAFFFSPFAVVLLFLLSACAGVPAVPPPPENSSFLTRETELTLDGTPQKLRIYGKKGSPAVLLWLWPPGLESYDFKDEMTALLKQVYMVSWALPGAAEPILERHTLSPDAFLKHWVRMCSELLLYLSREFPEKKLYLAGFSLGSVPALEAAVSFAAQHPGVLKGYIGIGQFTAPRQSLREAYRFLEKNKETIPGLKRELDYLGGEPPYTDSLKQALLEKWQKTAEEVPDRSRFTAENIFRHILEKKFYDRATIKRKFEDFLQSPPVLREAVNRIDFLKESFPLKQPFPVYLISGAHDLRSAPEAVKALSRKFPRSHYRLFPESGHAVFLSEPEAFLRYLTQRVLPAPPSSSSADSLKNKETETPNQEKPARETGEKPEE